MILVSKNGKNKDIDGTHTFPVDKTRMTQRTNLRGTNAKLNKRNFEVFGVNLVLVLVSYRTRYSRIHQIHN